MTKKLSYIIALLIALTIGSVHGIRINNTYFNEIETELKTIEVPLEDYQHAPAMMVPPDSSYKEMEPLPEGEHRDNDKSDTNTWTPSDRALETKFWLDSVGSFLTTVAPFVVPFIAYRKKKGSEDESE